MRIPAITIPLQTVPIKIHVHVSDVPESQYLEAKIISAQPYYPPTEEQSMSSDLAQSVSLAQTREWRQSSLDHPYADSRYRKQTAWVDGADEPPTQSIQERIMPVEISGALGTLSVLELPSTAILAIQIVVSHPKWICLSSLSGISLSKVYVFIGY